MILQPYHDCFLVDASAIAHRSYHQSQNRDPAFNANARGEPIGAVRLFTERLLGIRKWGCAGRMPTHMALVFDAPGRLHRHTIFPDYKAGRTAKPDDFQFQMPLMREAAQAIGVQIVEERGWEADDILGVYATYTDDEGARAMVISPDKDLCQLVRDRVQVFDFASGYEGQPGYRPARVMDRAWVQAKFGVQPELLTHVQALMGDATDNIPGIPGVGPKTAAKWIAKHGSLEAVLAAAATLTPDRLRSAVLGHAEAARLAFQLVCLNCDVEASVWVEDMELDAFDPGPVIAFAERVGMTTLAQRLERGG